MCNGLGIVSLLIMYRLLAFLSLLILFSVPTYAADKKVSAGTVSFYMENDLFAGTDRYYTSGVKIGWSSGNLEN